MPPRIELLKQAGFSDSEIGDWATAERRRMQAAGFADSEIDDEFGVTRPPNEVPAAFIERLKQGNWLYRTLGTAGEYAQDYYGDEPLGFSPENQEKLRKLGVVGDVAIPAYKPVDAALRSVSAAIAGIGAGLGQAWEEGHDAAFGPGFEAKGKAARDFAQFAQIAALLLGTKGPKAGAIRTPVPNVINEPVIALPRAEDFRNAAATISETQASFQTEQKLLRLWTDHGIPPTEVAQDALRDRSIAENIRSDSKKLPDVYVGTDRPAATSTQNAPATLAEPVQADSTAVPAEGRAAPWKADERSSTSPDASQSAMTAEARAAMKPPPPKPQRPFDEDYPLYTPPGADGQLLFDIEGRPLDANFIAGRRYPGKADEPLSLKEIKGALDQLGIPLRDLPPNLPEPTPPGFRAIYLGDYRENGTPFGRIWLHSEPDAPDLVHVIAHEFGHAIDHFTGMLLSGEVTPEEIAELRAVYSDVRAGEGPNAPKLQPEHFGYLPHEINRELVGDGLRAYITDPNYFKTVAPKTAARFRKVVNEHPYLNYALQLNSLGAIGLAGASLRGQDRDDQ